MTTYIGIDYSYTSPSICIESDGSLEFYYITTKKKAVIKYPSLNGVLYTKDSFTDLERFDYISDWVVSLIEPYSDDMVVGLEGYSYGSSGRTFQVAEACGLLKYKLWKNFGIKQVICIPPASVKKTFTGSGSSNKEAMYDEWDRLGMPNLKEMFNMKKADNPISDIVDSYAIIQSLKNKLVKGQP